MNALDEITLRIIPISGCLHAELTVNGEGRSRDWICKSEEDLNVALLALFFGAHRESVQLLGVAKPWKIERRMTKQ